MKRHKARDQISGGYGGSIEDRCPCGMRYWYQWCWRFEWRSAMDRRVGEIAKCEQVYTTYTRHRRPIYTPMEHMLHWHLVSRKASFERSIGRNNAWQSSNPRDSTLLSNRDRYTVCRSIEASTDIHKSREKLFHCCRLAVVSSKGYCPVVCTLCCGEVNSSAAGGIESPSA